MLGGYDSYVAYIKSWDSQHTWSTQTCEWRFKIGYVWCGGVGKMNAGEWSNIEILFKFNISSSSGGIAEHILHLHERQCQHAIFVKLTFLIRMPPLWSSSFHKNNRGDAASSWPTPAMHFRHILVFCELVFKSESGKNNRSSSSSFIGLWKPSYTISYIFSTIRKAMVFQLRAF